MKNIFRLLSSLFLSVLLACLLCIAGAALEGEYDGYLVKIDGPVLLDADTDRSGWTHVTQEQLDELVASGVQMQYEPNFIVELFELSFDDTLYGEQWMHTAVNTARALEYGAQGQGVRVGIIDSGCVSHADLTGKIVGGYDYYNSDSDFSDTYGHGTAVASIIAANANNGEGLVGMAPECELFILKAFEQKTTSIKKINNAIYGAIDSGCDVINMSFGFDEQYSEAMADAISDAYDAGIIVVAAVGNNSGTALQYPAAYSTVIGVGSVDEDGSKSSFSQYNESVFVCAPGGSVYTALYTGGYSERSGTSFASPCVSGLVAQMLSCDSTLTFSQVCDYLKNNATYTGDAGTSYNTSYGYGRINCGKTILDIIDRRDIFISSSLSDDGGNYVYATNTTANDFEGSLCDGGVITTLSMGSGVSQKVYLTQSTGNLCAVADGNISQISAQAPDGLSPSGAQGISLSDFTVDADGAHFTVAHSSGEVYNIKLSSMRADGSDKKTHFLGEMTGTATKSIALDPADTENRIYTLTSGGADGETMVQFSNVSDEKVRGDVNGDRICNTLDLVAMRRVIAMLDIPDEASRSDYDINGDGSVTTADLIMLRLIISELI